MKLAREMLIGLTITFTCTAPASAGDRARALTLKILDNACAEAREARLAPLRQQYIQECVQKYEKDSDYCRRFYRDYGAALGDRAPLFYDLPECIEAFEYRKHHR